MSARLARSPWIPCLAAGLLALLALGSKETALIPLAAVWLAALVGAKRAGHPRRPLLVAALAAALGVGLYLLAWWAVRTGPFGSLGAGTPGLTDPSLLAFAPKLLVIAAGALVSLRAAPMQSYAWLALRELTLFEWLCAALGLAALALLIRARDARGLVLTGGALLALAPTLVLSHALWLGFDRYLYMPLLLLVAAAAPHLAGALARARAQGSRLPAVVGALVLLVASVNSAVASSFYADHDTWHAAPSEADPREPTRYVLRGKEHLSRGDRAAAHAELTAMPAFPWPLPVTLGALDVALALGDEPRYDALLAQAEATAPEHVGVRFHRFHVALRRGDGRGAIERAPALARSEFCGDVVQHLTRAAEHYPEPERGPLREAAASLECVATRGAARAPR